eukprot:505537-Prymnesium_polylepis.1
MGVGAGRQSYAGCDDARRVCMRVHACRAQRQHAPLLGGGACSRRARGGLGRRHRVQGRRVVAASEGGAVRRRAVADGEQVARRWRAGFRVQACFGSYVAGLGERDVWRDDVGRFATRLAAVEGAATGGVAGAAATQMMVLDMEGKEGGARGL